MGISNHQAPDIALLADRVRALERQTHRLHILLFCTLVIAIALGGMTATFAQQKSISFSGDTGKVTLSADGLYFYDKHGHPSLSLYLSNNERPVMRLEDSKGRGRAFFGLTADAEMPRIEFDDTSDTERLYVGLTSEASGLVRTFTKSGAEQTSLEDTFLRIRDDSGTEQMVLGVSTSNEPVLKMFDSSHTERLFAGLYTSGDSGFTTYNSSGNSTWSSP